MKTRTEKDTLGHKAVPFDAYYGIQTQRAVENFPISGIRISEPFIRAYMCVKKAAALSNIEDGMLDKKKGKSIVKAINEVLEGKYRDQFVVDIFQMGAGTSFNMNCNEVIANRASEILGGKKGKYDLIHPNDHVNMCQSTNDTYPTAMRLSALFVIPQLESELDTLAKSLNKKSLEFDNILKSGRTHLQDAVPIRLGQEFKAYSLTISKCRKNISDSSNYLKELGIGGSAAGTGLNTSKNYSKTVIKNLKTITKINVTNSKDLRESMQSNLSISILSSSLRNLSLELSRICNDLRLLSSGPNTGLNEINLPAVAPGSSIMPGKINPSILEMTNMVCFQVIGCDTTISHSVESGQLELNVMMPVMAYNLLFALEILTNSLKQLRKLCIDGISANEETCRNYMENSLGLMTVLNSHIGYEKAALLAKKALNSNKTILDIVKDEKIFTSDELDSIFNVKKLTGEKQSK